MVSRGWVVFGFAAVATVLSAWIIFGARGMATVLAGTVFCCVDCFEFTTAPQPAFYRAMVPVRVPRTS